MADTTLTGVAVAGRQDDEAGDGALATEQPPQGAPRRAFQLVGALGGRDRGEGGIGHVSPSAGD